MADSLHICLTNLVAGGRALYRMVTRKHKLHQPAPICWEVKLNHPVRTLTFLEFFSVSVKISNQHSVETHFRKLHPPEQISLSSVEYRRKQGRSHPDSLSGVWPSLFTLPPRYSAIA